jgi:hypothetical protein
MLHSIQRGSMLQVLTASQAKGWLSHAGDQRWT